jgi:hypothetical protein
MLPRSVHGGQSLRVYCRLCHVRRSTSCEATGCFFSYSYYRIYPPVTRASSLSLSAVTFYSSMPDPRGACPASPYLPPPWIRTACELPTQPSSAWELSRGTVVSGTSLCHRNLDDHPLRTPSAGGGARQLLLACWGLREARGLRVILAPVQRIPNAKCKEDADGDTDSDAGASSTRVITRAITVNPHLHRESLGIWYRRWLSW